MTIKRLLGAAMAGFACVALLSSCAFLPRLSGAHVADPDKQRADAEMQLITTAVKNHDAAALKKLFSKRARENALDLDSGVKYFLSVFPSGFKNLGEPSGDPNMIGDEEPGKQTTVLLGNYEVVENGSTYLLSFRYFAVNQVDDPNNVGLYALAVTPYDVTPGNPPTASSEAYVTWSTQFDLDYGITFGSPGVYVPRPRFAAVYSLSEN